MPVLSNHLALPPIGYGTYNMSDEETEKAVKEALSAGYRLIDGAAFYDNEKGVGKGIAVSGISREEILVTSKVWNRDRGYEKTKAAFQKTLSDLGLAYLDLYLIHWPANTKKYGVPAIRENQETWRALEDLYMDGYIRSIGVSNFLPHHLEELAETARIMPMVDQLEIHPGWLQKEAVDYCKSRGIVVEAWAPLGRMTMAGDAAISSIAGLSSILCKLFYLLNESSSISCSSTKPGRRRLTSAMIWFHWYTFLFHLSVTSRIAR